MVEIPYQGIGLDGINNFLFNKKKLKVEQQIDFEGEKYSSAWGDPLVVVDPLKNSTSAYDNYVSPDNESLAYFIITYKYFALSVSNYTIRTRTHNNFQHFPVSWSVEGSYNRQEWTMIHSINNSHDLLYVNASKTYESESPKPFSSFRFRMTGLNSGTNFQYRNWYFHVSKIEFFGSFFSTKDPFVKLTCLKNKICYHTLFLITIIQS